MGRPARLHGHLAGREVHESLFELGSAKFFLQDFMPFFIQSDHDKNRLGDVDSQDADLRDILHDGSLLFR